MLKNVLHAMESGLTAQISLLLFVFVFVLILLRVFTLSKKEVEHDKHMPLNEPTETYLES